MIDLFDANDLDENIPEFSVSDISVAIKRHIEGSFSYVRVKGELGRVTKPASGHIYLDIKDEKSVLAGIIWKGTDQNLAVHPEEGLEVIVTGRITTFPGQSRYQIIINHLIPAGLGSLMLLLEKRKKQLAEEGLFLKERKKKLPLIPVTIGIITSASGAVLKDILHRLKDRFPSHVLLWPVTVQGEKCSVEVATAIQGFNTIDTKSSIPRPELIIVARGGGSIEDLWGFNEEAVVRAVDRSSIPIISAIGHETDITLLDYVADRRAPTPSAAAEILSQDSTALYQTINQQKQRLARAMNHCIQANKQQLTLKKQRLDALHPQSRIQSQWQTLDRLQLRLVHAMQRDMSTAEKRVHALNYRLNQQSPAARVARAKDKLSYANAKLIATMTALLKNKKSELGGSVTLLQSVSPLSTLARGYSITLTDSTTVNNVSKVNVGDEIKTRVTDGEITSTVTNIQRQ